jgi:hypothetical protein
VPICSSTDLADFFKYDRLPVIVNILLETEQEARDVPWAPVDFIGCRNCGFVWNRIFDENQVVYNKNYETMWSGIPSFTPTFKTVTDFMEPMGDEISIVEIGCGQGSFLKAMADAFKGRFKLGLGFDPAIRESSSHDKIKLTADFFTPEKFKKLSEKPVIAMSRHVIEHIVSPLDFIRNMADLSSVEKIVIETPNLQYIIENRLYYEFIYEHCSLLCRRPWAF